MNTDEPNDAFLEAEAAGGLENHAASPHSGKHQPVDTLLVLLLVVGFLLGPIKLLGGSWLGYLSVDGLAASILLLVFGARVAAKRPLFAASRLSVPLLLLAAFCVVEIANPIAPFIRSIAGLRSWLLYTMFYFVGYYTLNSVRQIQRLYTLLIVLGVVTAVYGIYQWKLGPQSFARWSDYYGQYANMAWLAQSGSVFRAFSTFVTPGVFGANMALVMLLAMSVGLSKRTPGIVRTGSAVGFVIMGVAIAASGSRGPAVHLLLSGVIAIVFLSGGWKKLSMGLNAVFMTGVAFAAVGMLIGPVVSERFSTIFDPAAFFWKWFGPFTYGLQIAWEHAFGMGLGYTAGVPQFISNPVFHELPTDNIDSGYGSAAAEMGFLGLAVFAYFAVRVGIEGVRAWKRMPHGQLRDLLLGPALYAATFPVVSVVFQPQAALPGAIYSWFLIGVLVKAPSLPQEYDADQLRRPQVRRR